MRVVAGDTIELVLAFLETSTPGQSRALKANGAGVFARDTSAARAVTFGTQSDHTRARGHSRVDDRHVGKVGLDRQDVVFARAMALFAADTVIDWPGARLFEDRLGIGDMTAQAAADGIFRERFAQVPFRLLRAQNMAGRHVPKRARFGSIM